jgi:hypothetical protein
LHTLPRRDVRLRATCRNPIQLAEDSMLGIKSVASAVTSDNSYRLFDDMPISIMLCELGDFRITYINESTR